MKKYKKIKKLEATEFRRLTGVKPETFLEMVLILQQAEKLRMSRGGKPLGIFRIRNWIRQSHQ